MTVSVSLLEDLRSALAERYVVERELGRGGMATVFLADDVKHHRRVAIKVMSPDVSTTVGAERFQREIQIAARLTHPHILPVHDSGSAGGLLYYVMPFVEGESLRARMDRESQLAVDDAIQIVCEIADALQYAHDQGVVHRDVKPENVLLSGGHAVVADFGIARIVGEAGSEKLTATGLSLGTAQYMSPEQFIGTNIDGRADLYSLACMAYEMLVGQVPFTGANAMAIIARATMELPSSIRLVRSSVPEEIEDAVMRALEKVPADRFTSVAQFKQALLGVSGGTGSLRATMRHTARHTSRQVRGAEREAWTRWRVGTIAAVALLVVGGGLAGWRYGLRRTPNAFASGGAFGAQASKLAVPYFTTPANEPTLRFLADGLTEALITRLSQVPALDVVSKNGVARWRNGDVEPDSVARSLGAGTVVVGKVQPMKGGRVRVSAELYDPEDNTSYRVPAIEGDTAQIVQLQGQVADEIASSLRERLGYDVKLKEQRNATRSTAAWVQLQRAARERRDADSLAGAGAADAARGAYQRADSLLVLASRSDPAWADAVVARADVAYRRALTLRGSPLLATAIDSGLAQVAAALALESESADAYELQGKLLYLRFAELTAKDPREGPRTLAAADSALLRSVNINKLQAGAWATLSQVDYRKHPPQVADALLHAKNAYDADMYLESANAILKRLFWATHDLEQFSDADHWCNEGRRRFARDPFFAQCALWMLTTTYAKADADSAWRAARRYVELVPASSRALEERDAQMLVAGALARAGLKDSARRVLVRARPPRELDPRLELTGNEAIVRAMLGDQDEAVELLSEYLTANPDHRQGFAERRSPWWRSLSGNPKFQALLAGAR